VAKHLQLHLQRFESPARWRWLLQDRGGALIADHEVRLDDRSWQFEAFADLDRYLRRYAVPDSMADETEIVAEVGRWIAEHVLGPITAALVDHAPAVVRVVVPSPAREIAFRPLELAAVAGRPLALQRVGLVWQIEEAGRRAPARAKEPVTGALRVLGLFSLPDGTSALNLRRERRALSDLMEDIGAINNRAIEWRVLQYGVTRARLRRVAEEGQSWDVVHISGHGVAGGLLLEGEDGTPDLVSGPELAGLLEPIADQVKLVTVSSCSSAASLAVRHLRLLGLIPEGQPLPEQPDQPADGLARGSQVAALATELVRRLDTAVLGMRFPVADDFAVALSAELYKLLLGSEQPLPGAVGLALPRVVAVPASPGCPPLSAGTPAMFGERALDLTLRAPAGPPLRFTAEQARKLAGLRPQPERFVGRVSLLAEASATLAPRSGRSGVLFHGMPGAGKTACAAELTHLHLDSFRTIVWHEAPAEADAITGALTAFAMDLEAKLPDLRLVNRLDDAGQLAQFLPALTAFCERERLLVVLDNLESLLTDDGDWRDPRWGQLVAALAGQNGLSRLIMTSRRIIADLDPRIQVKHIHALPADEAVLLARELPRLRALMDGTAPGVDAAAGRRWVAQALTIAQGHPALLTLADGQAAHPDRLQERLGDADLAWRQHGGIPDGFLTTGRSAATAEDYLHVLDAWTRGTAGDLPAAPATMFAFLCGLEENDRDPVVIGNTWGPLWQRIHPGAAPDPAGPLAVLTGNALVAAERDRAGEVAAYRIHPAVAMTGRALVATGFREMVDEELAAYWMARALTPAYPPDTRAEQDTLRAGRGAAPYLLRLGDWETAGLVLAEVVNQDVSRATAASLLPSLQLITAKAPGTSYGLAVGYLRARITERFDPQGAVDLLRQLRSSARTSSAGRYVFGITCDLIRLCIVTGRLGEALEIADRQVEQARQVGTGPWTQLTWQTQRLNVLFAQGQASQVLPQVRQLLTRAATLPSTDRTEESENPAGAREHLWYLGRDVSIELRQWQDALSMSAALLESASRRGAHKSFMSRLRLIDYRPLLHLGRISEALEVLDYCRDDAERDHDVNALGVVLAAQADVENSRGHRDRAAKLQHDALRYAYLAHNVEGIAGGHYHLGNLSGRDTADDVKRSFDHYLAAAVIGQITGHRVLDPALTALASLILTGQIRDVSAIPATPAALCEAVGALDGVSLDKVLTSLEPELPSRQAALDQVLDEALARARDTKFRGAAGDAYLAGRLACWDPVIAAILAARAGDAQAHAELDECLAHIDDWSSWSRLRDVLKRIRDGGHLTAPAGLDPLDIAIVLRALEALAGRTTIPAELWPFISIRELLGVLVEALLRHDQSSARECAEGLARLAERKGVTGLAGPLRSVVSGNYDPELARDLAPAGHAVLATVLTHIVPRRTGRSQDGMRLSGRISALSDHKAIGALTLVLKAAGTENIDADSLQDMGSHLVEGLRQISSHKLISPDHTATPGSPARTALEHLAARDEATSNHVWLALAMASGHPLDAGSPQVGALALLAFPAEIRLERDAASGWTLRLPARLAENPLAERLLAQLLAVYLRP
jgi:hypothetical protein